MEIFESLLDGLHTVCAGFSDSPRRADVDYTMADIGLSAFSLFFMQSESLLSQQRHLEHGHGTSNCHTLFGMKKIPTDNSIRLRSTRSPRGLAALFRPEVIDQLRERNMVLPLMPEFITPQDGAEKQDGEPNAAKPHHSSPSRSLHPKEFSKWTNSFFCPGTR
jgi:hypothetical protein